MNIYIPIDEIMIWAGWIAIAIFSGLIVKMIYDMWAVDPRQHKIDELNQHICGMNGGFKQLKNKVARLEGQLLHNGNHAEKQEQRLHCMIGEEKKKCAALEEKLLTQTANMATAARLQARRDEEARWAEKQRVDWAYANAEAPMTKWTSLDDFTLTCKAEAAAYEKRQEEMVECWGCGKKFPFDKMEEVGEDGIEYLQQFARVFCQTCTGLPRQKEMVECWGCGKKFPSEEMEDVSETRVCCQTCTEGDDHG